MVFDPTSPFCAYCYLQHEDGRALMKCGKCHARRYCSRDCQAQDWRHNSHRLFCGRTGEIGVDYEIKHATTTTGNKGLGVFALRNIVRNETILIERSVAENSTPECLPKEASVRAAVLALTPNTDNDHDHDSGVLDARSFHSKFQRNNIGQLHVTFSRVNHDCLGNSYHAFDEERGVIVLVASTTIVVGEEITYSYTFQTPHNEAVRKHAQYWDFTCTCRACRNPAVARKLDLMLEYDQQIMVSGSDVQERIAIATGKLLPLYNELECSSYFYSRLYSDLFQFSIARRATYTQAMHYVQLAYTQSLEFFGYEAPLTKKKHHQVLHPEDSPNYMGLEY